MIELGLLTVFIALFIWIIFNVAGKKASMGIGRYWSSLVVIAASMIPIAILVLIVGAPWPGIVPFIIAVGSGLFLFLGFVFMFKALETEQLTNAVALGEISPALLTIFGIFALNESVTALDELSIILIFAGAFLVISTEGLKINKKLIPAFLANASWAIYWLMLSISEANNTIFSTQVSVSRFVAIILVLLFFGFSYMRGNKNFRPLRMPKKTLLPLLAIAAVAGIADSTGDILFSVTLNSNLVAIGGALTALSPILVSIVSYFVFKDRLTKMQGIGFLIMVIGALILTLA